MFRYVSGEGTGQRGPRGVRSAVLTAVADPGAGATDHPPEMGQKGQRDAGRDTGSRPDAVRSRETYSGSHPGDP